MKSLLLKLSSVGSVMATLVMAGIAQAAGGVPDLNLNAGNFLGNGGILCTFIDYFFWFVITISVIMILYAAYVYVTAGDDTEKTTKGRKLITYAAVGIAVAIIANSLPEIVSSLFTGLGNSTGITGGCATFGQGL